MSLGDHIRLTQLEVLTALEGEDFLWNFVAPFAATFTLGLILVQFWVAFWVYILLAAVSFIVATVWYMFVHWRRRSVVRELRKPDRAPVSEEIAVLVKRVETDDVTAYYGWIDGHVYADYDGVRLAWTLSEVAHAHIEPGEAVPPTIQEKFARNLKQFSPNLEGYVDAVEKPEIKSVLAEIVADADQGSIPKNVLLDRVIEQDRSRIGGIGYDPRVVSEAYVESVPELLVEVPVEIETPTDGTQELVAVRGRKQHVRPEVIETRAQFSSQFRPDYDPAFELPAVDPQTPLDDPV